MVGVAAGAAAKVVIERIKGVIEGGGAERKKGGGIKRKKDAGIRDERGEQENLESDKYNSNII